VPGVRIRDGGPPAQAAGHSVKNQGSPCGGRRRGSSQGGHAGTCWGHHTRCHEARQCDEGCADTTDQVKEQTQERFPIGLRPIGGASMPRTAACAKLRHPVHSPDCAARDTVPNM